MHMIDVLKRLQELDANNSNIITENSVEECGPIEMTSSQPKTPATINITANSGEELGSMLSAIMKLAGVNKVEPKHLGVEHEPTVMTAEPALGAYPTDGEVMHGSVDKMNPEIEDESWTGAAGGALAGGLAAGLPGAIAGGLLGSNLGNEKESIEDEGWKGALAGGAAGELAGGALGTAVMPGVGTAAGEIVGGALGAAAGDKIGDYISGDEKKEKTVDELADIKRLSGHSHKDNHSAKYDTTPNDPRDFEPFDSEEYSSHPNDGDGKYRTSIQPMAKAMEEKLMADYKKFIAEDWRDEVSGGSDYAFGVHNPTDDRFISPKGTGISAGGLGSGDSDDEEGDAEKPQVKKKEEAPIIDKIKLDSELVNQVIKKFGPVVAQTNGWKQDDDGEWFYPVRQGFRGDKLDSLLLYFNMRYGKPGRPLIVGSKDMDTEL